jgi:TolA-binding protein
MNEEMDYKIRSYLKGRLSGEEAALFEQEIAEDEALRKEVTLQRFEMEGRERLVKEDLFKKMAQWDEEETARPKPRSKWWWWMRVLVPVLLIGGLVWYLLNNKDRSERLEPKQSIEKSEDNLKEDLQQRQLQEEKSTNESPQVNNTKTRKSPLDPIQIQDADLEAIAVKMHQEEEEMIGNNARTTKNDNLSLQQAKKLFKAGSYPEVIAQLQEINDPQDTINYRESKKLLGHSYFALGQYSPASGAFRDIVNQSYSSDQAHPAEWYLLLCLLPNYSKNKIEAGQLLNEILTTAHNFKQRAQQLKIEIEKRE